MIPYLARTVGKAASVGILGLIATGSAQAMETPNYLQSSKSVQPAALVELGSSTNLESRLTSDLEMSRTQPLEFIRGFENRYSPKNIRTLKKEGKLESEIDYATKLVSNISDPGVRFLSLYAIDETLGHSNILRETLELANDESAQFLERNAAIEHLGYLFEGGGTSKQELANISRTLYGILARDLERISSEDVTEEDLPDYHVIEALNTSHRFLQVHRNGEDNARLATSIYEIATDPSSHYLVTQLGAWVLDSTYTPSSADKLKSNLKSTAKKLPTSERKEFSGTLKFEPGLEEVWSYVTQSTRGSSRAPRFVYNSDDYLENLWDRFEDRFVGDREPIVEMNGLNKQEKNAVNEGLIWLKSKYPDRHFTYQLVTDKIDFNSNSGFGAVANTKQKKIRISKSQTGRYSSDVNWKTVGLSNTLKHEGSHILSKEFLGLNVGVGLQSEAIVGKWDGYESYHKYRGRNILTLNDLTSEVETLSINREFSEDLQALEKAKHWEKGKK